MISETDKERVRQATDIVALVGETVVLKQRGQEFWGCCPFHHEKSPSFHVNPATGLWKCFGCGKGGDLFDYVRYRENLEFPDAIRYLADRAGIEIEEEQGGRRGPRRNRLIEALEAAQDFYATTLMRGKAAGPARGREYFKGRGFGGAVCRKWHLGYAPGHASLVTHLRGLGFTPAEILEADLAVQRGGGLQDRFYERVMFPIHDEQGRCIGFGGRVLTDAKPKYLNTRETPVFHKSKHMFAFDYAKEQIAATGTAIVVEGYTDVIALHEAGFGNVVATLGTALSLDHVKTISRFAKTIICMFDGDAAGQKAADAAVQYLDKTEAQLKCVVLPDDLDPAEFVGERGAEALRAQLEAARPLIDFVFEKRIDGYDLNVAGKRVAALDEMAQVLAPLKRSPLLDSYATRLADALGFDRDDVRRRIQEATPAPVRAPRATYVAEAPQEEVRPTRPRVQLAPDERQQRRLERELLALMAARPADFRAHAVRIGSFSWSDSRLETMAWAMLATPETATPDEVVQAALAVEPAAARVLAGGEIASSEAAGRQGSLESLLDAVDLASTRRKVRAIKARLQGQLDPAEADRLFREASELQRHVNELSVRLSKVSNLD